MNSHITIDVKCAKEFLCSQGESPHDRGMSASLALHKARPRFPRQASDIAWSLCECLCLWVCVLVFVCMSLSLCQCLCLFAINFWRSWTDNWQTISSSSCFVFVCFEGTRVCVSDCVFGRLQIHVFVWLDRQVANSTQLKRLSLFNNWAIPLS